MWSTISRSCSRYWSEQEDGTLISPVRASRCGAMAAQDDRLAAARCEAPARTRPRRQRVHLQAVELLVERVDRAHALARRSAIATSTPAASTARRVPSAVCVEHRHQLALANGDHALGPTSSATMSSGSAGLFTPRITTNQPPGNSQRGSRLEQGLDDQGLEAALARSQCAVDASLRSVDPQRSRGAAPGHTPAQSSSRAPPRPSSRTNGSAVFAAHAPPLRCARTRIYPGARGALAA
jgi:hypothetical protein